jgi:hypothetical protein
MTESNESLQNAIVTLQSIDSNDVYKVLENFGGDNSMG